MIQASPFCLFFFSLQELNRPRPCMASSSDPDSPYRLRPSLLLGWLSLITFTRDNKQVLKGNIWVRVKKMPPVPVCAEGKEKKNPTLCSPFVWVCICVVHIKQWEGGVPWLPVSVWNITWMDTFWNGGISLFVGKGEEKAGCNVGGAKRRWVMSSLMKAPAASVCRVVVLWQHQHIVISLCFPHPTSS